MTTPSLRVLLDDQVLYSNNGKWLYPLFDLEDYLKEHPDLLQNTTVWDKVIGKAAAILILRMGGSRIHGVLMSELAAETLEKAGVAHSFDTLVPRIDCQTEKILEDIVDPDEAYEILCKRAGRC
jgi:zinc transport system ATP-binding protein